MLEMGVGLEDLEEAPKTKCVISGHSILLSYRI